MRKFLLILCCLPVCSFAQGFKFSKIQTGPYFGLQQGKHVVIEIGAERRLKEVKLRSPNSNALNLGLNYDYTNRILGSDLGYWFRPNRIAFTFGGIIAARSNFYRYSLGFSPCLGYKIWIVHAQAGYYFYPKSAFTGGTNNLFLSLRVVLTQHTHWKRK